MQFVVRGITLVFGNRRFWPYIAKPMLASFAVYLGIIAFGYWLVVPRLAAQIDRIGLDDRVSGGAATLLYGVLWWFLSGVVFVTIAGLTSSLLWDRLSYEVERTVRDSPPKQDTNFSEWLIDALPRAGFATLIFCGSIGCFWIPPVGVVLASWLCLYDYSASAYLRRGVPFMRQFGKVFACKGWPTFALTCGLMTLLPFINVLMLPALVAAGTLMVAESDRSAGVTPAPGL